MTKGKVKKLNLLSRSELKAEDTWKLEDIYISDDACRKDIEEVLMLSNDLKSYEGKLGESKETLLKFLNLMNYAKEKAQRVYVYSFMRLDQDGNVSFYKGQKDRAVKASMVLESAISFFVPEILSMDYATVKGYLKENEELSIYRFFIEDILRTKEHILSPEAEMTIALTSEMAQAAQMAYESLVYTDLKFGVVKDESGEGIQLTSERYQLFMESQNREVRKAAYNALYTEYINHKNTFACLLNSNAKADQFLVSVRNFESSLDMSLFKNNIPVEVYSNLIATIKSKTELLHRYVSLRKKVLNQSEVAPYDMQVALEGEFEYTYSFKEAEQIIYKGLGVLGLEYVSSLKKCFNDRWIDAYENKGKRAGAYAWGCYGNHPYVLMNWQSNTNSLFTLAHELGHAMHFNYSFSTQPFIYSDTPIFIAEVASTVNEVLLVNYLLDNATSDAEVRYLLEHMIKTFVATVFRQTQFAEFELYMHKLVENDEAITDESLREEYSKLLKEYYGTDYLVDDSISFEWARIPHFYSSFYVYQYATGYCAAIDIARRIRVDDKAKEDYIKFLKAGNSDYPTEVLKIAGVDMTKKDPILSALEFFSEVLERLEKLHKYGSM